MMENLRRYRKKADQFVVAIQLSLETTGFSYQKWGGEQQCKPGDWLVNNNGDVYTIAGEVFQRTYQQVTIGRYVKVTPVWAQKATRAGSVKTKEGTSQFRAGDYLVYNHQDGTDAYCVRSEKFESIYELDE